MIMLFNYFTDFFNAFFGAANAVGEIATQVAASVK